jgi:hypothetical protein
MTFSKPFSLKSSALALALMCGALVSANAAVSIVIVNGNAPGVGFNDTTPAAPIGGNPGTTLGAQRLFAFTYAANIWGSTLTSNVPVKILATFEPLTCTANSGTLGSAGATSAFLDFPGATKPGTLYGGALANKLAGFDQTVDDANPNGTPQIRARFNSNLGLKPDCLPGSPFYLGVDNNHGDLIDFPTVLLHEMGHGLNFQTFTSGLTGAPFAGFPSIWDHFLLDNRTNKLWVDMTPQERIDSAISVTGLSWNGANVTAAAPRVLSKASNLNIRGRAFGNVKGDYEVGDASFGPPVGENSLQAPVAVLVDQEDGVTGLACLPLSPANAANVKGNIALVSRGTCGFTVKAKNVQNAGAVGMIVYDNVDGAVAGLGGSDATITIPSLRVTKADGETIRARQLTREDKKFGLVATFGLSKTLLAGSDSVGRVLMNTPNPFQPGSSVSHYTTGTKRNQLMEPAINGDLTQSVTAPLDLTFELFKDIGW